MVVQFSVHSDTLQLSLCLIYCKVESKNNQNHIFLLQIHVPNSAAAEQERGDVEADHFGVNVPAIQMLQLTNEQIEHIVSQIDPLQESDLFGVDIYLQTLTFVQNLIEG